MKVEGALAFADHLRHNKILLYLDLAFNTLDGTVIRNLSESFVARQNASLTYLSFADNKQLGKDGGVHLGLMLRDSVSLRSLNLRACGINGAAGCEIARGLSVNTTLKELDLSNNGLGIKGGKSILDALRLNKT